MKKLLIASMIITASLFATSAYSQVYVSAHIGIGLPAPRAYYAPPPPVVYQEAYPPAPVVYTPAPPPCYRDRVVVYDHRYYRDCDRDRYYEKCHGRGWGHRDRDDEDNYRERRHDWHDRD